MKPEIENLKMWMSGKSTTGHQRVLAMREFEQLLTYTSKIEQIIAITTINGKEPNL